MRKIQACIGFDAENFEWLKSREETMSGFLNLMVTVCRKKQPLQKEEVDVKKEPDSEIVKKEQKQLEYDDLSESTFSQLEEDRKLCEEKIRETIRSKPRWIIDVRNGKVPNNKVLNEILQATLWLDCDIQPTLRDCRRILSEEEKKFDMEAFKKGGTNDS